MNQTMSASTDNVGMDDFLRRAGLLTPGERAQFTALTGGVSSEIYRVETAQRTFCIKRALARLKVDAVWEVPVSRNQAEAAWLRTVGMWLPDCVPSILAESPEEGLFAMAYLPCDQYPVWKHHLRDGVIDITFAATVGSRLAQIHSASAGEPALAEQFANDATFEQIRLEPYLRATARRHVDLAARLHQLADTTLRTKRVLVHGDVSPKNILCGPCDPVFIDAECAWYGDPAFDLAFCLNHLLLKSVWRPQWRRDYLKCFRALSEAYLATVDWEPGDRLERRCSALLPGLALARIDGKSPVEYLEKEADRDVVRGAARRLLSAPVSRLAAIAAMWDELP